jgi:hypothetical protein
LQAFIKDLCDLLGSCVGNYTSVLILNKLDEFSNNGSGCFREHLIGMKDIFNDVRYKGGTFCNETATAFLRSFPGAGGVNGVADLVSLIWQSWHCTQCQPAQRLSLRLT